MEALEIEEAWRKDLEEKAAFLEEKITNCLLHQADMVNLVLALQGCLAEVEDAVMEEAEEVDAEVPSSSSSCHDFTLLAMFLALFFLLFAPSSRVTQSHSARKPQKHHIIQDIPLVLITTRRWGYLTTRQMVDSEVRPQLILRPIHSQIFS